MIHRGRHLRGDVIVYADAVVVGTGAGGAIALRELAMAGLNVVALEEGGYLTSEDFNQREENCLALLFKDGGGQATEDRAIRILQGRGVGGSTLHNTNLCKRTPDAILEAWASRYHVVDSTPDALRPVFERIERELSVSEMLEDLRNANNDLLRHGTEALGWRGGPLRHNRVGCVQSGFCELGCAYNAKQNALKIVIPQATAAGAHVYSDVQVERILFRDGRATGVTGTIHDERRDPVARMLVHAPVVVLAASAIGSATLARSSNLPDPYDQAGKGLRLHPGAVVAGRFDEPIYGHRGIPQSYECTEYLSFEEGSDRRVWIVPAFAHPIGTAASLPGFGANHMRAMRQYTHLGVLTAMVHDETSGEVNVGSDGRARIQYALSESDRRQLATGIVACARILFAAGAREVTIPAIPAVHLKSARELDALNLGFVRPHGVPITAVHPMGSMRMGEDPRTSAVNSRGEHHAVRGLFVADASLFPTSLGVPPQISVYSFAQHLSRHIVARARGG